MRDNLAVGLVVSLTGFVIIFSTILGRALWLKLFQLECPDLDHDQDFSSWENELSA